MKKVMMLLSLSTIILISACEKDLVQSNLTELTLIEKPLENKEELSLRRSYKSMDQLRDQLKKVIDGSVNDRIVISAAWTIGENIGFINGTKYAVINRVTGEMIDGYLLLADNQEFWYKAPYLEQIYFGEEEPYYGGHHPLNLYNGITAAWKFGGLLGFTSKHAYWNTPISEFNKPEVWSSGVSTSGYLKDVSFWSGITNQIRSEGITAGFLAPNNLFVAFSGSKIFVNSLDKGEWIISKEILELKNNEPFAFLKTAPLPQLSEINAAFYNEGVNEYVFMNQLAWAAYNVGNKTWSYGSLSECFDENKVGNANPCPTPITPVCGCDGVTYNNDCLATRFGITSYTTGRCN